MPPLHPPLDVITVGSALRDVMFYSKDCCLVKNPKKDQTKTQLLCVEYGAKISSDRVFFEFGGGGANTAVNFAGLDLRTGIITAIGFDFDGRAIKEHLESQKVVTSLVEVTEHHRTGFSFLAVDENSGEHAAYVYYGAACDITTRKSTLLRHPTEWFYIASLNTDNWKNLLRLILSTRAHIAWNPGGKQLRAGFRSLEPFFARTDILILNRDEAIELILSVKASQRKGSITNMLRQIHSWGVPLVVITDGLKGSWVYDGKKVYTMPVPQRKPLDTTGAGDCYGSSFVAGFIRYHGNIQKAMRLATANASTLVQVVGAQRGLLKWDELPKNLRIASREESML